MDYLIKINYDSDRPTVLGRALHEFLEVETRYNDWFSRMCEYGFESGKDFNLLKNERVQNEGGRQVSREVVDHQLTIQMAKEIAMIQRNDKGKEARQYFIHIEEAWNTPDAVMARALKMADDKIKGLRGMIEKFKPQVLFAKAVETAKTSILIGELAKLIKQNGYDIGEKRLFQYLRENGYLIKRCGCDFNMPTQRSMEMKLFEVKETVINHASGYTTVSKTTKVTGKGQIYFINLFLKEE